MKLGKELLTILNKKYEHSSLVDMTFKGYDLSFKTDRDGNPVLLFLGKRNDKGIVTGDRFTRTLKYGNDGKLIKDHWERKGPAT